MSTLHDNIPSVPNECPLCDTLLRAGDVDTYNEFGICENCDMSFRRTNMKSWNKGWRPSKEEVEDLREALKKQPFFFRRNIIQIER